MMNRPTREALLARVEEIAPVLSANAADAERRRTLSPESVQALRDTGLFGLWCPLEVGGYDADFRTQVDVMIELARADMSACWTMMIGSSVTAVMAVGLPAEGFDEVFGGDGLPTAAGSLKPAGRAEPVADGYRVTGHWGFGSGIHHASFIVASCLISEGGEVAQPVTPVSLVVPIDEVQIEDDWHVAGLSGSGSSSYAVNDVFVPASRALASQPQRGSAQNSDMVPRILIEHASVSLGGARRALDELAQQAASKFRLMDTASVASKQAFQVELGRLEAEWESLRAGVHASADVLWQALGERSSEAPDIATRLRAVCALATEQALHIGGRALRHAGAGAVLEFNVLQRIQRDLTVSAQHFMISDVSYENLGRAVLGLSQSGGGR
jgi:alkylation response protein AidB-like acyl-CoA dehydrogenase